MTIADITPCPRPVRTSRLGFLQVATLEADTGLPGRIPMRPADGAGAHVTITIQIDGTAHVSQDGRETPVRPGEMFLVETHRPFRVEHGGHVRLHAFHVPRRSLGGAERNVPAVTAIAFPPDRGVAAMFAPVLTSLSRSAPDIAPAVGERLAGNVADLLATLIAEHAPATSPDLDSAFGELPRRVREYIDRNLGDPELSPERIAQAQRISVRYLHRMFESEGISVGRLIQRRRLERCAAELARRGRVSPTVSAVAQRWGFVSPAHFSRAFRATYGVSPRDWRGLGDTADR
ncbi:helix-turn-helix domain-containing protein [Embleya sp. NPDC008237]|uniref:helix-turn-helix domain-containing protein n=1 Tax=Embleya sp. NPDC008237 TaxID=3363978 RepID=UPI0036E1BB26